MSKGPGPTLLVAMLAISVLAGLAIAGHNRFAGPAILQLGTRHGLNAGDLLVLAVWFIAGLCCWRLSRRESR